MGRTARTKPPESVIEVPQKDFAGAVKIYRKDIKPAKTQSGVHGQTQSEGYKAIKKGCHIQPGAAKEAFKIAEMEEAHRDDYLLCLNGLLTELKISLPRDLVTMADGTEGGPIVPTGERVRPTLVSDRQPDDEFEEASEEELAGQEGRRGAAADDDPAPGTGASARKMMNEKATAAAVEPETEPLPAA